MGEFNEIPFHNTAECAAPVPLILTVDKLPEPYDFTNNADSRLSLSANVVAFNLLSVDVSRDCIDMETSEKSKRRD